MTNQQIIRILNIIAVIAGTTGGAATIPNLNMPPSVLAIGLFIAMVCKAVAAELVQVKGESDESQGITPGQVAGVQAVHDAAQTPTLPVVVLPPANDLRPPGPSPIAKAAVVLAFGLLILGGMGCAKLLPGQDPVVVRTEQVETQTYNTFDTFLKLDDIANVNPSISNKWQPAHGFAQHLRSPVQSGTNTVPLGIAMVLSVDQVKLAYEAGTATSNSLLTAVDVLSATITQIGTYQSLTNL